MPTKSYLTRFPEVFDSFALVLILLVIFILARLSLACVRIIKRWSEVTLRHRTFFTVSLYFVVTLLILIICGFNSSYDRSGLMVLLLFPMANVYVICLQVLWRFSGKGKTEIKDFNKDLKSAAHNPQKKKKQLDYFNDTYEIKLFRKGQLESSEVNFESDNSLMTVEDNSDLILRQKEDPLRQKPIPIEVQSESDPQMDSFEKLKYGMQKVEINPVSITPNLKLESLVENDTALIKLEEGREESLSISEEDSDSEEDQKPSESDSQLIVFSQADDDKKPPTL